MNNGKKSFVDEVVSNKFKINQQWFHLIIGLQNNNGKVSVLVNQNLKKNYLILDNDRK